MSSIYTYQIPFLKILWLGSFEIIIDDFVFLAFFQPYFWPYFDWYRAGTVSELGSSPNK